MVAKYAVYWDKFGGGGRRGNRVCGETNKELDRQDIIITSPRMLLSFATCTSSAKFFNTRHIGLRMEN